MIPKIRGIRLLAGAALLGSTVALAGCQTAEVLNQGYIIDEQALSLVPVGSSREQVLLALGSPSTTATFDDEIFYYISQRRVRPVAFMQPRLVDQRILAVYFGSDGRVRQIAHYGLQDGVLFDFITRATPTVGPDTSFLGELLGGGGPAAGPGVGGIGGLLGGGGPDTGIGPQR